MKQDIPNDPAGVCRFPSPILSLLVALFASALIGSPPSSASQAEATRERNDSEQESARDVAHERRADPPPPEVFLPFSVVTKQGPECRTRADCPGHGYCQGASGETDGVCISEETVIEGDN